SDRRGWVLSSGRHCALQAKLCRPPGEPLQLQMRASGQAQRMTFVICMSLTSQTPVRKIAVELRELRGGVLATSKKPVTIFGRTGRDAASNRRRAISG